MVDKAHGGAKRASSDASAGRQPGGQKLARVLGVPVAFDAGQTVERAIDAVLGPA